MELIANWLWQGSAVALVTAVMLGALKRLDARARYTVCWAALLAVLALPLPSFGLAGVSPAPHLESASDASAALVSLPDRWWTSNTIVLLALALWSAVQILRFSQAASGLQRARQRCRAFPHRQECRLSHWMSAKRGGRRAKLKLSEHVGAAAVFGGWRPVIAVAPSLLDRLTDDELDRVVIHEWAHVQRWDDVANAVQAAVRAIAGWHPAVWWLDRRLRAEREAACDEMAVAITGSTKAYAACLVKLSELPRPAGPLPALGMSSMSLTARIERVLSPKPATLSQWSRTVATAGIALVASVSFAAGSLDLVDRTTILQARDLRPLPAAMPVVPSAEADPLPPAVQTPAARQSARRRAVPPPDAAPTSVDAVPIASPSVASEAFHPDPLVTISRSERSSVSLDAPAYQPATQGVAAQPATLPAKQPSSSPWIAAADAGTAIGRGSKKAGLATAGFFTRMGKGIADSFSSSSDARSPR